MGCCVALAYLFALVRRAWVAVVPGARAAQSARAAAAFAPPARRPAPGGVAVAGVGSELADRGSPGALRPAARTVVVVGLVWFVVGLVGMHAFGWFGWAEGSLLSDTAFHSSGLWLAAAGATTLAVRA